ncbi:MAG: hypothetical protein PHG08_02950 [Bacilli bacterium]|nr:hypothetical protein [Bacilli bacterium]
MKTKKLFLLLTFAFIAFIATGCFGDISNATKLTFVQTPQAIYYAVGSEEAMAAQQEVLENVIVKVDDNEYTLKALRDLLGATVEGLELTVEGTHTLVIKYEGVTLTYVYKVVTDLGSTLFAGGEGTSEDPYQIATPEHLMNLATRVYGIASPTTETEEAWKTYYQASLPFLTTGLYYNITADLDFSDVSNFKPIGTLGGTKMIPFRGTINGLNHKIMNLTVQSHGDYAALFGGIVNSTIKNLTLENFNIGPAEKFAGTLAAYSLRDLSDYFVNGNFLNNEEAKLKGYNTIENITIKNSKVVSFARAGGIVAKSASTKFINCNIDDTNEVHAATFSAGISAQPQSNVGFSYLLLKDHSKIGTKELGTDILETYFNNCVPNAKIYVGDPVKTNQQFFYSQDGTNKTIYIDDVVTVNVNATEPIPNVTRYSAPSVGQYDQVKYAIKSVYSLPIGSSERNFLIGSTELEDIFNELKSSETFKSQVTILPYFTEKGTTLRSELTSADLGKDYVITTIDSKPVIYINNSFDEYIFGEEDPITGYYLMNDTAFHSGTSNSIYKVFYKDGNIISIVQIVYNDKVL